MKKVVLALVFAAFLVVLLAGPVLADGVSATGLGRCENPLHAPGTGAASYIWVPSAALENLNGGASGLHFRTP